MLLVEVNGFIFGIFRSSIKGVHKSLVILLSSNIFFIVTVFINARQNLKVGVLTH